MSITRKLVYCQICKKEVKMFNRHLRVYHPELTAQQYYDTYLRKSKDEGFCKTCKKPVKFFNVTVGYRTYCNAKCQMKDPEMQQHYKDSYFAKTGYYHNFQNPEVKRQIKATQVEKYGGIGFGSSYQAHLKFDNCMHRPEVVRKVIEHRRMHFNGEYFSEDGKKNVIIAAKNPEKTAKQIVTRYKNGNGVYYTEESLLKRKLTSIKFYKDKVTILKFRYGVNKRECLCKCNVCGQEYHINYLTLRTRLSLNVNPCMYCNPIEKNYSYQEKQITDYIYSISNDTILENDRNVLNGKELDIYIPNKRLAIEYNGLFWHDEDHSSATYLLDKTKLCEANNIQVLHIFEDEWLHKQDIVKSRLNSYFGLNTRIFARKCVVREVSNDDAVMFLIKNHIQGACVSKYRYGLYYNDELVSLMTFGKSRFNKNEFELLRFCNKLNTNVVGGASKLFTHFLRDHQDITEVISYADRRWSRGQLYEKLGFTKLGYSNVNYFYVTNGERYNRMLFQKHKLVADGADPNKSEHEIMYERGYRRIYDCGCIKYKFSR